MAYDEKYRMTEIPHNVIMEGRRKVSVSGVSDVESFDENEIVMNTSQGLLIVRGDGLHIEKLSLDSGDIVLEGTVDRIDYEEDEKATGGLFGRLFK